VEHHKYQGICAAFSAAGENGRTNVAIGDLRCASRIREFTPKRVKTGLGMCTIECGAARRSPSKLAPLSGGQ
jgi:hypothetical protein